MKKENKEAKSKFIQESYIDKIDKKLLSILLKDKTTNKNIIWAKNDVNFGYTKNKKSIKLDLDHKNNLKGVYKQFDKSDAEKNIRMKENAEVFTPAFVCNLQNNMFDNIWFNRKNVFNTTKKNSWKTNKKKIVFNQNQSWQDYVQLKTLEITCGEAPYIASRYDVLTGNFIDLQNRIGILDRKIRVINENTNSETEWFDWVVKAFQAVYGFEWYGDSLLIARKNLFFSFIDYYINRFDNFPSNECLETIAKIIAWNFWQMDGLESTIPHSDKKAPSLADFLPKESKGDWADENYAKKESGIKCLIKNWSNNKSIAFEEIKIGNKMKFDFVIGNPPLPKK
ncbi:MAG: restriction endonuclease subunit M [Malacoplasma sp.]|nr:restriction endonuclease subunit M [Malacoplasma sp.]